MDYNHDSDVFKEYLKKIKNPGEDHCWLCGKTPEHIRQEFFKSKETAAEEFEDVELDDIAIISYKTKKPICAACYFELKRHPDLIQEILERPEDDVW
jgi:hypothetical protein